MAQRPLHTHARWQKRRTNIVSPRQRNQQPSPAASSLFHSICRYHYWLLYRLPEFPDPEAAPGNQLIAPVGKFPIPDSDSLGCSRLGYKYDGFC